ncbi:hypothetical protein ABK905_20595 [Acerihabitans sp. KWT182]|uniref:Uncharacterized protein n=1 Tax=Acerihabitans sp. KWT182 TaxID=3157919 RepID=A0AAU7Q7P3_9GAMM
MPEREKSLVLDKVFSALRAHGVKRGEILAQLRFPVDEVSALTFNNSFFMGAIDGDGIASIADGKHVAHLILVK